MRIIMEYILADSEGRGEQAAWYPEVFLSALP